MMPEVSFPMTKILEYLLFVLLMFVTLFVLVFIYLWFHNRDIQITIKKVTPKTHWVFTICQVLDILAYLLLPVHKLLGWFQPFLYDNQRNGRSFRPMCCGKSSTRLPTLCSSGILQEGGWGRSWVPVSCLHWRLHWNQPQMACCQDIRLGSCLWTLKASFPQSLISFEATGE